MQLTRHASKHRVHKRYQRCILKGLCPHIFIVQELCESRGGHPGLSVLTSLMVSVDVKQY